jgi:hypothetical protein
MTRFGAALSYPGAEVASMSTPELEISLRRDREEIDAANKPKQ